LSLEVPKGQFLGLLGPNGAGKTTTISSVIGVVEPTEGKILVMGHDVVSDYKNARKKIGVSPQEFSVNIFQTVYQILYFHAGYFGIYGAEREKRIQEMLSDFKLEEHKDKKFQHLSGGLKRRTIVAKALIHQPPIIILDEPTAGVDVETRKDMWELLRKLHTEGKTILLTSHYLEEVENLCERVVIIKSGKLIADLSMKEVKDKGTLENLYLETVDTKEVNK
jgi:ABC-2 type transport system ATP-binding protein